MTRLKIVLGSGVLLFLALVIILAAVIPYRPTFIAGPIISPAVLSLEAPLADMKLHVFNTGANRMSSLLVGPAPPWRAAPAFIIEHPRKGLVAFDLGLSHEVAEHGEEAIEPPVGWLMESRGRIGQTLEAQMKEDGLDPSEVDHVLISHLHGDHTGVAAEFGTAKFYAGRDTRQSMIEGDHSPFQAGSLPEWREVDFDREDTSVIAPFGSFDAAMDLFGDGSIYLVAAGGHTQEDIMALVNLPKGPVLLTGDAVVHFDWLASDDVERIAGDPERAAVVRNQVRALKGLGETLIIPGHDLRQLGPARADLVLHHPERFVPSAWPIEPR